MPIEYNAPSILIDVKYDVLEMADLLYPPIEMYDRHNAWGLAFDICKEDFDLTMKACQDNVKSATPIFTGVLHNSIHYSGKMLGEYQWVIVPPHIRFRTNSITGEPLPPGEYQTWSLSSFVIMKAAVTSNKDAFSPYSQNISMGINDYAMAVEKGSIAHISPLSQAGKLDTIVEWATAHGMHPIHLRNNIAKTGTPSRAMFLYAHVVSNALSIFDGRIPFNLRHLEKDDIVYEPGIIQDHGEPPIPAPPFFG